VYDTFVKTHPDRNPDDGLFLQLTELSPDPRTIKTHLPFSLLNPNILDTCKVVYVAREPKDVVVSLFHYCRKVTIHGYVGSLESFIDHFVNDTLICSPYWTHVKEAWMRRKHPSLHFIYYEDLKANPKAEISRLQQFLGTNLDDDQINNVMFFSSFVFIRSVLILN
ncbi:UNVERIFIED_CONTAM: hypothetical protein GTU68_029526, partial [Idotea baltica]|nr:hypothetical protein [Idotea baltica]